MTAFTMRNKTRLSKHSAVDVSTLGDPQLVAELNRRVASERHATADVIRALIEFNRRQLFFAQGAASLYTYCRETLHYSEHAAFNRIEVARVAARFPQVLASLEDGSLHLSGARVLAPHLTADNIARALELSRHKSKREIEGVVARLANEAPLADVAEEKYRIHLTISRQTHDTLRQVKALLSHQVPDGNTAVIFDRALQLLLKHLQRQRMGAVTKPAPTPPPAVTVEQPAPSTTPERPVRAPGKARRRGRVATTRGPRRTRAIPRAIRREVWRRDQSRCAFVGAQGRCTETHRLEVHHVVPYADGGPHRLSNLELRCRAHNRYEAEQHYGADVVAAARARRKAKRRAAAQTVGKRTALSKRARSTKRPRKRAGKRPLRI